MSIATDLASALDVATFFGQATGLEVMSWQRDYLSETRPLVLCKGRQVGASWAASVLAAHCALYQGGTAVLVSPTQRQSSELASKARQAFHRLGVKLATDSATTLALAGAGRIISLPGTAASVRGWSADLLLLDEAAYINAETWTAARALIAATGGRLVVQSTPAVAEGPFHDLVTAEDDVFARMTVRSDEVPTISSDFLEAERQAMTEAEFGAEYLAKFIDPGVVHLFSEDRINQLVMTEEDAP